MKDNTEQAFSHCFLSTHAQHFFNMNVYDANIYPAIQTLQEQGQDRPSKVNKWFTIWP